jgi:1,4-alpha-glucan branching enzyme
VFNMTPVPRANYRVGIPSDGYWHELLNSDGAGYGGSNAGNAGGVMASHDGRHGQPYSLELVLPPLSGLILRREG